MAGREAFGTRLGSESSVTTSGSVESKQFSMDSTCRRVRSVPAEILD